MSILDSRYRLNGISCTQYVNEQQSYDIIGTLFLVQKNVTLLIEIDTFNKKVFTISYSSGPLALGWPSITVSSHVNIGKACDLIFSGYFMNTHIMIVSNEI